MSTTIISEKANEKGTFVVTASFTDENGDSVIPVSITWSLSRSDGTIVNSRQDVSVGSPAATVNIVLYGSDLATFSGDNYRRILTIEALYNSDLGGQYPIKDEMHFAINDLVSIT